MSATVDIDRNCCRGLFSRGTISSNVPYGPDNTIEECMFYDRGVVPVESILDVFNAISLSSLF
jgi:hypothetical protein